MLPDFLGKGLKILFCGTAAGKASALAGHYYAGRGNSFWKTLFAVGLTPRLLEPSECHLLPDMGIGLTDLAKGVAGMDRNIPDDSYAPAHLTDILSEYRPRAVAFNGKKAAAVALGSGHGYGRQKVAGFHATTVWVLPSTSGAARGFFSIDHWKKLAEWAAE